MESEETIIDWIHDRGHGTANRVLHTASVAHVGWEMDNAGWIVEMADGSIQAFTTSHGGIYPWSVDEMKESLKVVQESAASIRKAIAMIPATTAFRNG